MPRIVFRAVVADAQRGHHLLALERRGIDEQRAEASSCSAAAPSVRFSFARLDSMKCSLTALFSSP
jgi:hypothetical protein